MVEFIESAPAKLNLFLHIKGKRKDGYHLLESAVHFVAFGDVLTFKLDTKTSLHVVGPFAQDVSAEDNLVLKAIDAYKKAHPFEQHFKIVLEKRIPVGAGLGGGTADAGATLRFLQRYFNNPLSNKELEQVAASIGADGVMCLRSHFGFVSGVGEKFISIQDEFKAHVVLINPMKKLLTPDVFRRLNLPENICDSDTGKAVDLEFLKTTCNDLLPPALELEPEVKAILACFEKEISCLFARMSGSGPTCFGLFEKEASATRFASNIQDQHPEWWVQTTQF